MSKSKFKYTDLLIFSILAVLSELAGNVLVDQLNSMFYMSFASIIAIIALLRWGPAGVLVYIATGMYSFLVASDYTLGNIMLHIVANMFIAIPSLFILNKNRDSIIKSEGRLVLFILLCYLSLSIGKGLAIFIITTETDGVISYLSSQSFVFLISIIFAVVLSKKSEIICDMDEYLIRINKEKEEGRVIG